MTLRRFAKVLLAAALSIAILPAGAVAAPSTVNHYAGALSDGGTWIADVPAPWNGTLVLYSHGFGTLSPADAPSPATAEELLARGYALVGSSYDPNGSLWALSSAARDQFESLAAIEQIIGHPHLTLAIGTSMGGLVSGQEAQTAGRRIDGVLATCGLMHGGVDLNNYQLDGEYAISQLLSPDQPVQLVDYASPAVGAAAAAQLSAIAAQAQTTAQGRARVAMGTALLNMPIWSTSQAQPPGPRDAHGIARAQYDWMVGTLPFIMPGRYFIELAAGGNASWNAGVDYARLLARSPYRDTVRTLYREAGLDLNADLRNLTRHAAVRAKASAVAELSRTSTLSGHLDVPVLTLHTLYDQLAPVEVENRYSDQVRAKGDGFLLRQAYVARRGHCAFSTSELIAGLLAVEHRARTGRWDRVASTGNLQAAAVALDLSDAPSFVHFTPGEFVSHREFRR